MENGQQRLTSMLIGLIGNYHTVDCKMYINLSFLPKIKVFYGDERRFFK